MNSLFFISGYLIYFIIILFGVVKKSNRKITLMIELYMWFLIAFNNSSADYYAYEEMYLCSFAPRYAGHEFLFILICRLCLSLGLSYLHFRCLIAFFIVFFTCKAIAFFTNNVNEALSLYLIFPFMGAASGLRQACSSAVILYSVRFLMSKKRCDLLKFLIGVLIATFFHYSSLFYLIFIFAKFSKSKNISLIIQCTTVAIVAIFIGKSNLFFMLVSMVTTRQKTLQWFRSSLYISPLYVISIALFVVFLFVLYEAKIIIKNRSKEAIVENNIIDFEQVELLSRMIIVSLLAFAGAILNSVVFLRLVLTLVPIGYAICSDAFVVYGNEPSYRQRICKQLKFGMVFFCIFTTLFVYGYWIGGDTLRVPVGNILFGR